MSKDWDYFRQCLNNIKDLEDSMIEMRSEVKDLESKVRDKTKDIQERCDLIDRWILNAQDVDESFIYEYTKRRSRIAIPQEVYDLPATHRDFLVNLLCALCGQEPEKEKPDVIYDAMPLTPRQAAEVFRSIKSFIDREQKKWNASDILPILKKT